MPTQPGKWLPETDTLDTWFSSAQWPVVVLKTGKKTDFASFYPTSVMETGYDILPFWVMRMIFMGLFLTNKEPFQQVYLHGLVRDSHGKKMSKSKGNVVNPIEIVKRYGADALRMALIIRSTAGQDKSVAENDFKSARNLTNKLWNAARYVLEFAPTIDRKVIEKDSPLFEQHLHEVTKQLTENLSKLQIGLAADYIYDQFWHWYCDLQLENYKQGQLSYRQLLAGLIVFLKLLHPFLPFVTEAVWQQLVKKKLVTEPLLMLSTWPQVTVV